MLNLRGISIGITTSQIFLEYTTWLQHSQRRTRINQQEILLRRPWGRLCFGKATIAFNVRGSRTWPLDGWAPMGGTKALSAP